MKTENIVGAVAILVSMGAVGCGAAPTSAAGAHTITVGGAGNGGTSAWVPPETTRPEPPALSIDHVHRHGGRINHSVVHTARR
jgi:hypothetical protein